MNAARMLALALGSRAPLTQLVPLAGVRGAHSERGEPDAEDELSRGDRIDEDGVKLRMPCVEMDGSEVRWFVSDEVDETEFVAE